MIQGVNISLRPFRPDDADNIIELKKDIEGMKTFMGLPFPKNIENEKNWISEMYSSNLPVSIYFAIEERSTSRFAGYCVAKNIDYISRNVTVGIIINKDYRGKGYFKEVSYLFYNYLFMQLNMNKLYSFVQRENFSLQTDFKIGFEQEGIMKNHLWQDGEYKDLVFVSLFKERFYEIWEKGLENFKKKS